MQKIDEVLISLLLRHSCVIIPEFGGFVTKSCSAKLDLERGLFLPPSRQLLFNKNLVNNDGLLISEYASVNSLSYAKSQSEIENLVVGIKNILNQKQSVYLERIGIISFNFEGNLEFEQDRYFNFLLSSFGLSQVQFVANKKLEIEVPLVKEKNKEEAPLRKLNFLKYVAAASLLPLAFYSFWIPTHSDVLESGLISYNDFNPFYKKELGNYTKKNNLVLEKSPFEEKIIFEEKVTPSKNSIVGIYKFDDRINIPIRIQKKKEQKKIPPLIRTQKIQNNIESLQTFEYIVGCFSSKNNAKLLVLKLINEGFNAKLVGGSPLVRVSIGSATSKPQIEQIEQKALKKNHVGWILKK